MSRATHCKPLWPLAWTMAAWLAVGIAPTSAQSQRKAPSKPSSSQEKEDPLASLLQQANDAINQTNFAAALDPPLT